MSNNKRKPQAVNNDSAPILQNPKNNSGEKKTKYFNLQLSVDVKAKIPWDIFDFGSNTEMKSIILQEMESLEPGNFLTNKIFQIWSQYLVNITRSPTNILINSGYIFEMFNDFKEKNMDLLKIELDPLIHFIQYDPKSIAAFGGIDVFNSKRLIIPFSLDSRKYSVIVVCNLQNSLVSTP